MAPIISHTRYSREQTVHCPCGWHDKSSRCGSTHESSFYELACPDCTRVILVVDTLGADSQQFAPSTRPLAAKRGFWRFAALFSL